MSQVNTFGTALSAGAVLTLTGTSGGAVGPNGSGNINILGGAGVTVAGNAGTNTLTIMVAGAGVTWNTVTTNTSMVASNGYVTNSAGTLTMALPATAAVGDTFEVTGLGAGGWVISQQAGQNIIVGTNSTTVGVGGSVASTNRYDSMRLICVVANTTFKQEYTGTFTVT